ncbi:DegT/DnrJ/EryC1/StrS family aminotransferase [Microbacterium oxydans]|nr:DegT/DnrJ/EryC1/StrS family aminotransferase [Microbacterium oxydans]
MIEDSLAQEAGVPWAAPRLRFDDVKGDLQSVVEGDQWTRGMYTRILEDRLGDAVGRYCVLTSSGTSALMASLFHAADRGGRRVAVPDFGYHAAARAAALSGATLHLLDSSADTPTIDAAAALSLNAPITVGMHYMDILFSSSLGDLRTKKRLLIEDSAASLLVQDRDRRAGTLGDMSVISLHASKPIAAGEGGAIFVDDRQGSGCPTADRAEKRSHRVHHVQGGKLPVAQRQHQRAQRRSGCRFARTGATPSSRLGVLAKGLHLRTRCGARRVVPCDDRPPVDRCRLRSGVASHGEREPAGSRAAHPALSGHPGTRDVVVRGP